MFCKEQERRVQRREGVAEESEATDTVNMRTEDEQNVLHVLATEEMRVFIEVPRPVAEAEDEIE